jgi:hypothetical protein
MLHPASWDCADRVIRVARAHIRISVGYPHRTVSFDPSTDLYTYSYTVQNLGGDGRLTGIHIAVNSLGGSNFFPYSSTSPSDSSLTVGWGGTISTCEFYLFCFASWNWGAVDYLTGGGLPANQTPSGFSFQTTAAPMVTNLNTYMLWFPDSGVTDVGQVVVPDYLLAPPPPVGAPELPTWTSLSIGFLCIVIAQRRWRRTLFRS